MVDVERIQKINDLALNLMKQGLASDRDSAIEQAAQIFKGGKSAEEYTEMRETMEKVKKEAEPQQETPVTNLSQDEIKNILEQNTNFIVKKFKEFHDKIATLEQDISMLRTKMTYNRLPTAEDVKTKKEDEITVKEAATPVAPPQTPTESHPRSGNYTDEDVSIEKFFYMGSK